MACTYANNTSYIKNKLDKPHHEDMRAIAIACGLDKILTLFKSDSSALDLAVGYNNFGSFKRLMMSGAKCNYLNMNDLFTKNI